MKTDWLGTNDKAIRNAIARSCSRMGEAVELRASDGATIVLCAVYLPAPKKNTGKKKVARKT
jgi:hypothetical protein